MPSMSSAAGHHGLQSCLESWQAHPLKKPTHNWPPDAAAPRQPPTSNGGWSSLYSLPQPSRSPLDAIDKSSHKTPTPIPSTSYNTHLRMKNWELCTETLGCETGAAYTLPMDSPLKRHGLGALRDFPTDSPSKRQCLGGSGTEIRKRRTTPAFPPPLTTLSGEAGFRLKSRRQEGRLLLLPFNPNVFQAERKDGRLRLRMLPAAADYLGVVGREMNDCDDRGFVGAPPPAGQLLIPLGRRISATKKKSLVSKMRREIREDHRRKKLPPVVVAIDDIKISLPTVPCPSSSSSEHVVAAPSCSNSSTRFLREEVATGAFTALRKKREAQGESLRRMEVEAAASAHTVLTTNDINMGHSRTQI